MFKFIVNKVRSWLEERKRRKRQILKMKLFGLVYGMGPTLLKKCIERQYAHK